MNNLLLTFILFFAVIVIIRAIKKTFEDNLFIIMLQILLAISIYDGLFFMINSLIINSNLIFSDYFYKLSRSIIFNLLYGIAIFYIYDKKGSKSNR